MPPSQRGLVANSASVADVALAAGFGSQRRFNAAFAGHYRLNPTALRRARQRGAPAAGDELIGATVRLAYRPPYDIDGVLGCFAARAVAGVEAVEAAQRTLRRTLAWTHQGRHVTGWLAVRHHLRATASSLVFSRRARSLR